MSRTIEEALLTDIRACPTDDTPRLVYADWLEDHGQAARAEFIHVQCELARLEPTHDRCPELHLRQLEILAEQEREWLGPWADRLVRWRFERGMLHEVTIQPGPFCEGAELFARHPIHTVAFVNDRGTSLAPEDIVRVLDVPHLALVRGLELSGCRPDERMAGMFGGAVATSAWLGGLAKASHITRLEVISLPGCTRTGRGPIEPGPFAAFCSAPHLASLRSLDLSDLYGGEGPDTMPPLCALLANATFAPGLRRLSLAQCVLSDDAVARLAASTALRGLAAVNLAGCDGVGAAGLRAFLNSRPTGRLTDLTLPDALSLRELGEWPGLGDIQALGLSVSGHRDGASGGEDEWLALFRSPHLHPTRLGVSAETIPNDALVALFQRDWLAELRALDISTRHGRHVSSEALGALLERDTPHLHEVGVPHGCWVSRQALASWPTLPRLTRFDVFWETPCKTWLLASAPLTPRIPRIDLAEQCEPDDSVRALAESPWARGICHLGLAYNFLTAAKVARLASAPFARHLEALHLGSEHSEGSLGALETIADDRLFPRLRDVVVGDSTVEGGIDALRRRFGPRLRVWSDC